ncbi:MAG: sn-glycerol-1-phosphate dehydrogenase [Conexivisphaerales archaeon]
MELPHAVYVGEGALAELGDLLRNQALQGPLCIATGPHVRRLLGKQLSRGLRGYELNWVEVKYPTEDSAREVGREAKRKGAKTIIGFGGGKTIDVSKVAAQFLKLPMISVPTSASHDGISSPFASLRDSNKPYSKITKPPYIIAVDLNVISSAPKRLFRGGFGDLVAKVTSVRDWELARDEVREYYGDYAASLARMSARHVMERAEDIRDMSKEGVRALIEALISSGVAAGIAGSSRPCSGSEHLISHTLELIAPGKGLHGEKTGLSTVMMAELHGLDWESVRGSLERAGCPTRFSQLGITEEQLIEAIVKAPSIRPERYTILHKLKLDRDKARSLARRTGVI